MYRALILEDDPAAADALRAHLARFGAEKGVRFQVEVLSSALVLLDSDHQCDIYSPCAWDAPCACCKETPAPP